MEGSTTSIAATLSPRALSQSPPCSSPTSRTVPRTGSPTWTHIVRGVESEPVGDHSLSPMIGELKIPPVSEVYDDGNGKKHVWNKKPSNESVEIGEGVVVMGAIVWPPLSESTKASPKLSSSDSSKNLSDFVPLVAPVPQGSVIASLSSPLASPSSILLPALQSPSQSSVTSPKSVNNANNNNNNQTGRPVRQKSMKREGGNSGMANGETSYNHNSSVKSGSGGGYESSNRDNTQSHANRDGGSRNAGGDHPQRRNSFRRGNGEPHQNYGGRRGGDQDRSNHDWNHQRSFNGRDGTMRVSPRGIVRTPPVTTPFVHPVGAVTMQPFINPMGIPDMPMVYFSPTVPYGPPLTAPIYFPAPDPLLKTKITGQIDYYFSNDNLVKDTYLRQNMDENGWVHVGLIAGFKKVQQLTDNVQLIMDAVQSSSVVEAQGDKIRRRGDWMRWIMPPAVNFQNAPGLQSPSSPSATATLISDIQSVTLDERATDDNAEATLRSSPGDLKNSFSQATKDGAGASSSGY